MSTFTLELALRFAGMILTGLVLANFVAAKRWRYAENLAGSTVIVRQVFYVHCAYIVVIIAALALLCLGWPGLLLKGEMSRVLCVFFALFWGSRVVVQLTYYDRELRRADRGWDIFFLGVFLVLSAVFTLAAVFQ
ncbi:MAG: hypothetical protein NWT08_10415 [Akkermansiaceae bacterium]|nr:hypothetical protein [Akkermansiaceae bacterium]MDP4646187.1 hypothetical protein [Akkermansiaceae bacterium]MDP4720698.1 hypothetical protein [Akkermansiaceae bacterium]MDP4780485.1 hypothetical protein [Akkermansiaceae bacterium]MDP4847274.1 hypothetical protein [Akkermansiaceae bacterium]